MEESDLSCKHKFGIPLVEMLNKETLTEKERIFVEKYNKYMPVIVSDSVMNNICRYLESVNFDIKNKIKIKSNNEIYIEYLSGEKTFDEEIYDKVLTAYNGFKKELTHVNRTKNKVIKKKYEYDTEQRTSDIYIRFSEEMENVCSNISQLVDCLILIFYYENPSSNKNLLWNVYGDVIFENIKKKNKKNIMFPFPCKNGEINYLNQKFELEEIEIC